ncbi:MAG TPA: hypothetical protein PLZ52_04660 [Bacteroidales bacterium]|nr:hypothetical protein [Bacteroidales bacterium]HOE04484.1 hypothetical protein [Bacteroidales bacterium]
MIKRIFFFFVAAIVCMQACETIYNYDLSFTMTPGGQSVRNALADFIPESVNARKGSISNDIEIMFQQIDASQQTIIDSLRNDLRPTSDTTVVFSLDVSALDPDNKVTTRNYTRNFSLPAW